MEEVKEEYSEGDILISSVGDKFQVVVEDNKKVDCSDEATARILSMLYELTKDKEE